MKQRKRLTLAMISILIVILLTGCASTPIRSSESAGVVFKKSLEVTQKAAVNALTVQGFDIKQDTPTYVEGFRPRKVGLMVGSGGESVGIWLQSINPTMTQVKVDTAKSFVGIAGQKNWNSEIISEMEKGLGKGEVGGGV